jgi:hypothetical protein
MKLLKSLDDSAAERGKGFLGIFASAQGAQTAVLFNFFSKAEAGGRPEIVPP